MLTARGWWFLALSTAVLVAGVSELGRYTPLVPVLGLMLTGWVLSEWFLFAYRTHHAVDRLRLDRVLLQGGRVVPAAWVGVPVTVRATVTNTGTGRLPFALLIDRLPADAVPTAGAACREASLEPGDSARVEYALRPDAPGELRFEGLTVHVADLAGLFYRRAFLRVPAEYLVLPPLAQHDARRRTVKRFNALPPPGIHRLRKPGSGDELLDLRDYAPGDPPKTIAWKASARRGTLITRVIESDVPVRCVVFVDASDAARLGPPGRSSVVRFAGVAAAVVQAAAGNRDLVGLTVVTDAAMRVIPPARTKVHVLKLLHALTAAAAGLPAPLEADAEVTARHALPLAQELYPDRLDKSVNSLPFGLFWMPVTDSRWFVVIVGLLLAPLLFLSKDVLEFAAEVARTFANPGKAWMVFAGLAVAPGALMGSIWVLHGVRGFLKPRMGRTARRKQLATLFAALDRAGPATVERYLHDDGEFTRRAGDFLHAHRVRLPANLYAADGTSRYRNPARLVTLANAVTKTLSHARDNELYVVLVDLTDLAADLEPLLKAVRAARARHHTVLVLLPWPADVPWADGTPARGRVKLATLVREVLDKRTRQNFELARRLLTKAGATVLRLDAADSVRLVLARLDQVRAAGVRR